MADPVAEHKLHKTFTKLAQKGAKDLVHTLGLAQHNPMVIGLQEDEMDERLAKLIKQKFADYRRIALRLADKFEVDFSMSGFMAFILFEVMTQGGMALSEDISPTTPGLDPEDLEINTLLDDNNED